MDVLFVHGYNVTSTKTYGLLPQRLKAAGHRVRNIYLSQYITLDNELTLTDVVHGFQSALIDTFGLSLGKSKFACITHSTGGLVVRSWISSYFGTRMGSCPLSHLVMLAPPNFGSRLASVGKSRLSRLRSLQGVEPGLKILDALELGSRFQWKMNDSWLESETAKRSGFYPFVIAGQWIDKKIWDVIIPATYERGSDGVVRASSANLNFRKVTAEGQGKISFQSHEGIAFLLTPKSAHSDEAYGLMGSVPPKGDHPVLTALLQALAVKNTRSYKQLAAKFQIQTQDLQRTETYYDGTPLERYSQLIVRVHDQHGTSIKDYSIELIDAEGRGDRFPTGFLPHSVQNPTSRDTHVYYLNYDRVVRVGGGQIGLKIHSASGSPMVAFEEVKLIGPAFSVKKLLAPNQSTYVDVAIHRRINKNVFRLTKKLSYQKFDRQAGPEWID